MRTAHIEVVFDEDNRRYIPSSHTNLEAFINDANEAANMNGGIVIGSFELPSTIQEQERYKEIKDM